MTQSDAVAAPTHEPGRSARWRRVPAWPFAAAVLVAGLAGAWWLSWSTPVVSEGGFGVTLYDHDAGRPFTLGIETLCLDGPGSAVIEDVTVEAAGLTVADWAVRPRPEPPALAFGAAERSLVDTDFGAARRFSGQCDAGAYTELAVELHRHSVGPASTESIDLHWRAGLRSGVLTVPVSVVLCPAGDVTERCADAP